MRSRRRRHLSRPWRGPGCPAAQHHRPRDGRSADRERGRVDHRRLQRRDLQPRRADSRTCGERLSLPKPLRRGGDRSPLRGSGDLRRPAPEGHASHLPDYINHILDRQSMAWSVARLPFLDHELVEFCASIPPSLKVRKLTEKYVLRRALRGILPPEFVARRKRPLTAPYRQWLRGELPEFARTLLSARSLRDKGFFDPQAVTCLLREPSGGERGLWRVDPRCPGRPALGRGVRPRVGTAFMGWRRN